MADIGSLRVSRPHQIKHVIGIVVMANPGFMSDTRLCLGFALASNVPAVGARHLEGVVRYYLSAR